MRRRALYVLGVTLAVLLSALAACSGSGGQETTDAGKDAAPDGGNRKVEGGETDSPSRADGGADTGKVTDGGCALGPEGEAIELECAGLYSDWKTKTVSPLFTEYLPGLQLWSDGAVKTRWVYLPHGKQIDTSDMDEWTFPVGTKFFKEFRLPEGSTTTPVRIETRLLWKQTATTWYRTTYRWSADGQTSATELTGGEYDANGHGYEVPSQFECNTCHNGRKDGVLGFEAVGLSAPGTSLLTLAMLEAEGILSAPPSAPITIPGDAVESTALGWLHVNCGTACHNGGTGEAKTTGFLMRLDVATLTSVETTDTYTTGWNVPTGAFHIPGAAATYRLAACDLGESAAYYRADHRDGVDGTSYGTQMPPIDSHKVDEAGVAQLAAWIVEGCDGGADAAKGD